MPSEFLEMMDKAELKNVILELFEQQRELNARLAEKDKAAAKKDMMIASLSEKLDTLIASQDQVKLDLEAWLAKERQWNRERQTLNQTIADLKDVINVLKKEKFKGTSQKVRSRRKDDGRNDGGSSHTSPDTYLMADKESFDGSRERKNSLFFGSQKMVVVSATFHTLLATCHARGISRLKYLKDLYRSLVKRRTDYGNMLTGLLQ